MNKGLWGICLIAVASVFCLNSFAEPRPRPPRRDLEYRIGQLERQSSEIMRSLRDISYRLDELEANGPTFPPEEPRPETIHACLIVDSGYSKTFVGQAKSKLDAEYSARLSCQSEVNASYCGAGATLKCDSNKDAYQIEKFICVVIDSGYSKSFRGEGITAVAAEAHAKSNCQKAVNASYCGKVQPRCEPVYF